MSGAFRYAEAIGQPRKRRPRGSGFYASLAPGQSRPVNPGRSPGSNLIGVGLLTAPSDGRAGGPLAKGLERDVGQDLGKTLREVVP